MQNTPLSYTTVEAEFAPLKNLNSTTLTDNFALVFNDKCADPFDDWTVCIQNWTTFAKAIKDAGLVGIAFDNEEYSGKWSNYPDDVKYKNKSLQEYQDQVRLRGREIMQAVSTEFPNIKIITFHGPYISEPQTPEWIIGSWPLYHELKGPFFAGFLEGMGSAAMNIDGGEIYQLRTKQEFADSYNWQKFGMSSNETNSSFIVPSMRQSWRDNVSISWGVYNQPWWGATMNSSVIKTTLENALSQADDYVWLYLEGNTLLAPGGIGQDWVDAIRSAKNTYLNTQINTQNSSCLSDINQDNITDITDYALLVNDFLKTTPSNPRSDINQDGLVDITDYALLVNKFLKPCE